MSRASRIALLCLCFLCIVALAVILATAIFSGGGETGGGDGATPSGSVSASSGSTSTDGVSPSADGVSPSATPTPPESMTPSPQDTPDANGERVSFRAPGSEKTFTAIVDAERFRYMQNGTDAFFDTTAGNDRVFIEFCYFADKTAEVSVPSFLSDYVDHTDFNEKGLESIGNTGLSGYSIFATDGANSFEAWLIDENQGGMLAVVMSYSNEEQAAAQRAIFDSLALG